MAPESGIPEAEERVVEQAPVEETVVLEAGDPREPRDPEVTREAVEVIEPAAPRRERVVPKEALDAERGKRKRAQELYRQAEAERQRLVSAAAQRAAAERQSRQRASVESVDWNSMRDAKQLIETWEARQTARLQEVAAVAAADNLRTRALLSEKYFRRDHPDYDAVMRDSGVTERITLNPQTGQPADPYLHALIFAAADPAEAGYTYARGLLAEREEQSAEQRGYQRGQADTVHQVVRVADRPRGIATLPSSGPARESSLSFETIDKMSEPQKRELKKKNPALWQRYLEEA